MHLFCHLRPLGTLVAVALLSSCHPSPAHASTTSVDAPPAGGAQPLILAESEGEHRVHRPPPAALSNLAAPFIIKLDRRNGGAPEFVMLMEDIAPGQGISPHMHPNADEILFIRDGAGTATLAGKDAEVLAGATIYMPRNTSVRLKNTGTQPLRIIAIFSQPGYENYMRDISVPEGEVAKPLTLDELTAIRARHHADVVYAQP